MMPPVVDQVTAIERSGVHGTTFDPSEDRCKHEFSADGDILNIVKRFVPQPPVPMFYAEQDMDLSVADAYLHVFHAREAYEADRAMQAKYPTWDLARAAFEAGKLVYAQGELYAAVDEPPPSGGSSAVAGQGEAAAGSSGESVT